MMGIQDALMALDGVRGWSMQQQMTSPPTLVNLSQDTPVRVLALYFAVHLRTTRFLLEIYYPLCGHPTFSPYGLSLTRTQEAHHSFPLTLFIVQLWSLPSRTNLSFLIHLSILSNLVE